MNRPLDLPLELPSRATGVPSKPFFACWGGVRDLLSWPHIKFRKGLFLVKFQI
jgi:hypothetical protein